MTNIELLHNQLQNLQNQKQKGVQIRRGKVILNEEKPTKFFYLKEQQQQKKTIQKLKIIENNQTVEITENKDILQTIHQFFTEVYTTKPTDKTLQTEFLQCINTILDEPAKQNLDQPISPDELKLTIQNTDTNKSPGIDGLPVEFCQTFWPVLKDESEEISNFTYIYIYIQQQNLDMSQRTGVITLTHKKDEKKI